MKSVFFSRHSNVGAVRAPLLVGSIVMNNHDNITLGVPPPVVTSTNPNAHDQGATNKTIAVNGTGFINGATVATSFSGTGITVNSTTFGSSWVWRPRKF